MRKISNFRKSSHTDLRQKSLWTRRKHFLVTSFRKHCALKNLFLGSVCTLYYLCFGYLLTFCRWYDLSVEVWHWFQWRVPFCWLVDIKIGIASLTSQDTKNWSKARFLIEKEVSEPPCVVQAIKLFVSNKNQKNGNAQPKNIVLEKPPIC